MYKLYWFRFILHAVTDLFYFAAGEANYLNASKDETINFGTPKSTLRTTPWNYAEQWILIVPAGRTVQKDFDIFELEDSKDWKNDYVEFRETSIVVSDSKSILTINTANTKPNSILRQGNMVWLQFMHTKNLWIMKL